MRISMIAAMTTNRVIGKDNDMPWHLPDDLQFFKKNTLGKPVIMGRKTFESLGCRPLPGRPNYVISRQTDLNYSVPVFDSVEKALQAVKADNPDEVVIMGGGQLYSQMMEQAERLYLTLIDADIDGDTFFPDWQQEGEWFEVSREHHPIDARHQYAFDFITLERAA
ncbi:type 3 dihydrofolate reductase [Thiomicrorhabdus sediminis]|uniref:Dihydrofolate reductase n=2 Tax=Thiomicrorhabdus sediminis TaxID=2580412 RepID=A0A4P9K7T0_9GAMM|nr:type 3 dihydrofolate reductase [Thiomicrorhabdus sediminis]QCU91165.1 type 3 dihydrofolate reductase [Thiomicrorhabdus sediminis]